MASSQAYHEHTMGQNPVFQSTVAMVQIRMSYILDVLQSVLKRMLDRHMQKKKNEVKSLTSATKKTKLIKDQGLCL